MAIWKQICVALGLMGIMALGTSALVPGLFERLGLRSAETAAHRVAHRVARRLVRGRRPRSPPCPRPRAGSPTV